jgi:hypothetical protein
MVRMTERFGVGKIWMVTAVALACVLWCAPARAASWWQPPQQLTWYWQLTGTPRVEPVDATDIDGFDATPAFVADLHARGQHVICYIDVGTAENWRPDYAQFPPADLGSDNGWPGEKWLNITDPAIRPIMAARFQQQCQQKGFDAVEPDNMDGYENSTGFSISASQQAAYDEWVAQEAHSLGMAVFQKNDPEQAATLQPSFDGALDEQCNEYSECSSFAPYVSTGKPVLDAEYQSSLYPGFCSADAAAHIMGALYALALDGSTYKPCFGPSTTSGAPSGPGGGAPKSPAPARPRAVPRVVIGGGPLKAVKGVIHVRLRCPSGETFCAGALTVQALMGKGARLLLGSGRFHVKGGRRDMVAVKLRPAARRRLGRRRRVSARLDVLASDRAGLIARSHRVVELRIVRPR